MSWLQLLWEDYGDRCDGVVISPYAPSCEFTTPLSSISYYTAQRRGLSARHSSPACMDPSPATSVQSNGYTGPVLCPLRISSVSHGQLTLLRRPEDLPKRHLETRSRLRRHWKDVVPQVAQKINLVLVDLPMVCQDRGNWRDKVALVGLRFSWHGT